MQVSRVASFIGKVNCVVTAKNKRELQGFIFRGVCSAILDRWAAMAPGGK
jgi:hypothetical protein